MTPVRIVIHCSDSPNGRPETVADIRAWHLARGWKDIGYHGIVMVDGGFGQGRPCDQMGAHVEGHNDGSLGLCMIGKDKFSKRQFDGLRWALDQWCGAYKILPTDIFCHRDFDTAIAQGKTCPNMQISDLRAWYVTKDDIWIQKYYLEGA